jgi:pimeloyl-ACP methyl ester carboxylesterase
MPTATDTDTASGPGVRHTRVSANGLSFHVALSGPPDAPLLLCLHGFPECWYSWRHQLAALSDRFLVAAPDLRGYGETDKPDGGYDIRNLAGDAAALVAALGRESAHIAGHDWGALVACAAAAWYPGAVDRLIILNCPHPAAVRTAARSPSQLLKSWYVFGMQIPGLFDWRLAKDEAAIIPRVFMRGAKRRDRFTGADLDVFRRSFATPGTARAALQYYRTNLSPLAVLSGRMDVPAVRTPTLVLYGRDDPYVGPTLFYGHERHFRGPYEMRYIPDCGHWTQQEVPDLVNEALAGFLAR